MMQIVRFDRSKDLAAGPHAVAFGEFLQREAHANFFQSPEFLSFIEPVSGYRPVLYLAVDARGRVTASLLGTYQQDGGALKAWLSRRLIIWGGPIGDVDAAGDLVARMLKDAVGRAIYIEFRNHFDTAAYRDVLERNGLRFKPHLNFLLPLDTEEGVMKRLSSNRRRQVRSSIAAGAEYGPARSDQEVDELYGLLSSLYRSKVGKPLPDPRLFRQMHEHPAGRIYVVRFQGRVIGGSTGPMYRNEVSYQWYVCGDNSIPGVHASVLATWAQIEDAVRSGCRLFDFMGAGRPGQGYGVHEFKARFGGTEVNHGRWERVLNRPLYELGVLGLKVSHRLTALTGPTN